ncbi:MAG: hypothetical protein ACRDFX_13895 [Chloroflexota bacterium]
MRRLVLILAIFGFCLAVPGGSSVAASTTTHFRGNGWTLTLVSGHAPYAPVLRGTLMHNGQRYHTEGDWIPAGDAGGDLLRFFGHPFPNVKFRGLVGVATLYSTCVPNCAASRVYSLKALSGWTLPGTKVHSVHITIQPR